MSAHVPVLVDRVLEVLALEKGARVADATLGLGGHAEAILSRIGPSGIVVGSDRDAEMLEVARERLAGFVGARVVHAPLSRLRETVRASGLEQVDAVLFDLGICSAQLDDPRRGFRFDPTRGGDEVPLDMRMDRGQSESAAELLDHVTQDELAEILRNGDVPMARRTAKALLAHRPIHTAAELVAAVEDARIPRRRHHPATLVFQALRLRVNDEPAELEAGLAAGLDVLAPGGRIAVLSYHSGEDRRVKQFLAEQERGCICPPRLPQCGCGRRARVKVIARGEGPSPEEVASNPRARSARLRAAELLPPEETIA